MVNNRLSPIDSSFLDIETATRPQVIGILCRLDSQPDKNRLRNRLRETIDLYPKMKYKITKKRYFFNRILEWEEDSNFNIDNHLKWVEFFVDTQIAESATINRVESMLFEKFIDNLPPWQMTILSVTKTCDTNSDERKIDTEHSLIYKVHHSWADGVGGMDVFHNLCCDIKRGSRSKTPRRRISNTNSQKINKKDLLFKIISILFKSIGEFLHPAENLKFPSSQTSNRKIAYVDFSRSEMQEIKAITKSSFNAVCLGIVSAGLAKYISKLERRKNSITNLPSSLNILIPLNLRKEKENKDLGNKLTVANIRIKNYSTVSINSIQVISNLLLERSIFSTYYVLATISSYIPKIFRCYCLKKLSFSSHFICTYIRSPSTEQEICGAKILGLYAYPALMPGHSLGIALASYAQNISISVDTDPIAIQNPNQLLTYMIEEKNKLLSEVRNKSLNTRRTSNPMTYGEQAV